MSRRPSHLQLVDNRTFRSSRRRTNWSCVVVLAGCLGMWALVGAIVAYAFR